MSPLSLFTLKILGPTLARALLASFNIPSGLTNEIAEATIAATADKLLQPAMSKNTLAKQIAEIAGQMAKDIRPLFAGSERSVEKDSQTAIVLGLSETLVSDVSPLSDLSQLQHLDLSQTQASDVSPLINLSQLQELRLS